MYIAWGNSSINFKWMGILFAKYSIMSWLYVYGMNVSGEDQIMISRNECVLTFTQFYKFY